MKPSRLVRFFLLLLGGMLAATAWSQESISLPRQDGALLSIKAFRPTQPQADCTPLALISPGAGGSENGLAYLAEGLRQAGWLAIVMGHKESGPGALKADMRQDGLRGGLLKLTTDSHAYEARLMDIDAALSWANNQCQSGVQFVALLGHSMGAATVMLEAGARNKLGVHGRDKFHAYVALSPQGPGSIFPPDAWSNLRKPVLMLTGTQDKALEGAWQTRTVAYDNMPNGCKWLGVIDGATHMNFAGNGMARRTEALVLATTRAFLDNLRHGGCGHPPTAKGIELRSK